MPRHIQVSPDEDLSQFEEGSPRVTPAPQAVSTPKSPASPPAVVSERLSPMPAPLPDLVPTYTDLEEARTVMAPDPRLAEEARALASSPAASQPAAVQPAAVQPAAATQPTSPALPAPVPAPSALRSTQETAPTPTADGPSPLLAAVASFILPGAGQLWAGQTLKGGAFLVLGMFTCCLFGLVNLVSAADAYLIAEKKQKGLPVGDWTFF